jgi:hypothetical protein
MSLISFSMSGRLLFLVPSCSESSSLPDAGPEGGVEARQLAPRVFRMPGRRDHFVATTIIWKLLKHAATQETFRQKQKGIK